MNYISDEAVIGENVKIGIGCIIEKGVEIGNNVDIGDYCVIRSGVVIGNDTRLMSFVELREGTKIGANCYIDSRVSTSGNCIIGNNVTLRYSTIIARGCIIEDDCYLCPRVMTNNLDQGKNSIGGAHVKQGSFIGTHTVLQHGITIGEKTVVGSMAFVAKSCEPNSVLIGIPAKPKN